MLKAVLGANETATSVYTVRGLPPLEIRVGRDGYFDGYIASATGMDNIWLTPSFDESAAITAAAALGPLRPLNTVHKGSLAIVRLQYKKGATAWTRVIVEKRPDAAHVVVYLIDYGAYQMLNARSLYAMPEEMRKFPPQAFPIVPRMSAFPDFGPGEWSTLEKVRITVRLRSVLDNKFVCDQLTVYDAVTRSDMDLGTALRNGADLERFTANAPAVPMKETDTSRSYLLAPVPQPEPEKGVHLSSRFRQEQRDLSVLVVCAFGVIMAVASILMVIGFTYRRIQADRERRQRRQRANQNRPANQNDSPGDQFQPNDLQDTLREVHTAIPAERTPEPTLEQAQPTTSAKPSPSEELKQEHSIISLHPKAIAVIAALMGSSSALLDRQFSRTIAIESGKENSAIDGSYYLRPRFGAGTSNISTIRGSSSPPGRATDTPGDTGSLNSQQKSTSSQQTSVPSTKQPSTSSSSGQTTSDSSSTKQTSSVKASELAKRMQNDERPKPSESSSTSDVQYFEPVIPDDVQQMLRERALMRKQIEQRARESSSLSSFVSAVSFQETTV